MNAAEELKSEENETKLCGLCSKEIELSKFKLHDIMCFK